MPIVNCATGETTYTQDELASKRMADSRAHVPSSVSPHQVRLLLLQRNILDQVEEMILQQDRATQIAWNYSNKFRRDDPLLAKISASLGLSDKDIDDFFVDAAKL